jgi:uncharacterized Zn finger protein
MKTGTTEDPTMITIACPWCDVEQGAQLVGEDRDDAPFRCLECGTTVLWMDEPEPVLELAVAA